MHTSLQVISYLDTPVINSRSLDTYTAVNIKVHLHLAKANFSSIFMAAQCEH